MNYERAGRGVRNLALAATAIAGGFAIACAPDSKSGFGQRLPTIEPADTATAESKDNVEVTRANYTQFLSNDPNIKFSEIISDYQEGGQYLRESVGQIHKGVNLEMSDQRDSSKLTVVNSQEQLMGLMVPLETNMDKKVQALLFALFDSVVEASKPADTVEPGVLHTIMLTKQKFGCFESDDKGNAIIPSLTIGVTVDFVHKSIGYDFPEKKTSPITDYDPTKQPVCIN